MTLRPLLLACLAALPLAAAPIATRAAAQAPADLPSLFPRRAPVSAPEGELARLDVPAEVLAACRPDLSDLRLVGADGREVAYAVLEGLAPDRAVEMRETVLPELTGVDRGVAEAGRGGEREPPVRIERFALAPPPPAPAGERWDLVLSTGRRELVRTATVSDLAGEPFGSGEDERRAGRLLWTGSLFRLSDGGTARERLRIPLPPLDGAGDLLLVTEGRDDDWLEPRFRYERVREIAGPERARVPLEVLEVAHADGRTVVEVARPRGLVPDRLEIASSTPAYDRRVEVWDRGPGAEGLLGWGSVRRLTGAVLAGAAGAGAADEIPLRTPRGERLRIEIADGDSPPLGDLAVFAAVRRPALVFALPAGSTGATLYFGGGRALAPRYDLQRLVPLPAAGERAEAAELLYDPARLPAATLGEPERNPRYEASPALAFAMRPGAALPRERWAWRRPLRAHPSAEGLVRLRLAPEDLARARDDLADLRIAEGREEEGGGAAESEARQWAYLVGDEPVREPREIEIAGVETDDGATRYELVLPAAPIPVDGLTLTADAPFFDRPFRLEARRGERTWRIAEGRLVLPPRDPRPVEIVFPDGPQRLERLILEIENGGDAPLELTGATAWLPLPEIYFAAPAGRYDLLLGNPAADAPRYELARVRDVVLTVAAGDADTGELQANPGHRPGLGALLDPRTQRIVLWTVLALAVLGLGALTLRLARREE